MFKKTFVAALAAFALVGGAFVGIATPALADDEIITDVPAAEVSTPAEEPATEAEPGEPDSSEPPATEPAESAPAETETAETESTDTEASESTEDETQESDSAEAESSETEASTIESESSEGPSMMMRLAPESDEFAALAADPVKKIAFCHATASESNPYVFVDTSVNAFFNAGHDTHQNFEDIVQPFSYVKQGQTIDFPGLNWDAEHQAIFYNGCNLVVVIPGVATASVFFTAASCTAAEQLVLGTVTNATWGAITDPAGDDDYSVTATRTGTALFDGGLTEVTFHGELDPINDSEECDNTEVKKVEFCHATGSEMNPFNKIETSVNAFFNAGHDTHQNFSDIVPPFSYIKQGEVIDFPGLNWDAEGQAFFNAGCEDGEIVIVKVATASVSFTPATCKSPELLVLNDPVNATWGAITDPLGDDDYFVTATADAGSKFAGNLAELSFHGELDPIDDSEDCDNTLVKKVEFCHATGSEMNPYVKIETSVNAFFNAGHNTHQNFGDVVPPFSYLKQGEIIDFPGLNWDAEGQAFFENGCKDPVLDVLPVVTFAQFTCDAGSGSYTLGVADGVDPATVAFTVNGTAGILAGTYPAELGNTTVTVQAVAPNELDPTWVNPPAYAFVAPAAASCVKVPTLALTGAALPLGALGVGGGLLFVGLVALFMRRRQTTIG